MSNEPLREVEKEGKSLILHRIAGLHLRCIVKRQNEKAAAVRSETAAAMMKMKSRLGPGRQTAPGASTAKSSAFDGDTADCARQKADESRPKTQ